MNLQNPTDGLRKTKLYNDYTKFKELEQELKDKIGGTCNKEVANNLNLLLDKYSNMFNTYLNTAQAIYDGLLDATNCVASAFNKSISKDQEFKNKLGNKLDQLLSNPKTYLEELENLKDKACNEILDEIKNIEEYINNEIDKTKNIVNILNSYKNLLRTATDLLAKATSMANCIANASNSIAKNASVFDPKTASIFHKIEQTSGDVGDKINAAKDEIENVLDMSNKINDFIDSLKF